MAQSATNGTLQYLNPTQQQQQLRSVNLPCPSQKSTLDENQDIFWPGNRYQYFLRTIIFSVCCRSNLANASIYIQTASCTLYFAPCVLYLPHSPFAQTAPDSYCTLSISMSPFTYERNLYELSVKRSASLDFSVPFGTEVTEHQSMVQLEMRHIWCSLCVLHRHVKLIAHILACWIPSWNTPNRGISFYEATNP